MKRDSSWQLRFSSRLKRGRGKMQIYITGANGFIGGAVASALIADGHTVRGLVRSKAKAAAVAAYGVEAVVGSLDDAALLQAEARAADAVINAASSDHRGAVEGVLILGVADHEIPEIRERGWHGASPMSLAGREFAKGHPWTRAQPGHLARSYTVT